MAEGDRNRVEPRMVLVGRGLGATPERIAELQARAEQVEKNSRKKPTRAFSAVLKHTPSPPTAKEEKSAALPKTGPRPALAHPGQREAFGRPSEGEQSKESIVLKG